MDGFGLIASRIGDSKGEAKNGRWDGNYNFTWGEGNPLNWGGNRP